MSRLLDPARTIHAAYLAGLGKTVDEAAKAIGVGDTKAIRQTLALYHIRFKAQVFGIREVKVNLTKPQLAVMERAATARGIFGDDKVATLLEIAARAIASDPGLLDNVLDDGYSTPKG